MPLTLNKQTQKKLTHVAETTGLPEQDVVDRALDILIRVSADNKLQELKEERADWQDLGFESWRNLEPYDEG